MKKKQILVVTVSPIFPPNSGGKMYLANMILPLTEEYDFHLIAYASQDDEIINHKYEDEYKKHFKTYHFIYNLRQPYNMNKLEKIRHYLFHIIHGMPLMDCSFYSKEAIKIANKIVRENHIDIIETHNLHTCFIRKEFPEIPALLVCHNIEGNLFPFWVHRRKAAWKNYIIETIAQISRKNTNDIELRNKWKYEAMSYISKEDMNLADDFKDCQKVYLPMPFSIKPYNPPKKKDKFQLLWLGGFDWYPNLEGMEWFIDNVYPYFTEMDLEGIELHIVGKKPTEKILKLNNSKSVFVHGWVDSIEDMMNRADLLIVPILSGSGTRIKIIESICHGKAIVSTSKGAQGSELTDGVNIVIRDDPKAFYDAIMELKTDWNKIEMLSRNAYDFAVENHDLKKIMDRKKKIYESISK